MNDQLQNYIKQMHEQGISDDKIREELLKSGWSKEDVDAQMESSEKTSKNSKETDFTISDISTIGFFITILEVIAGKKEVNKLTLSLINIILGIAFVISLFIGIYEGEISFFVYALIAGLLIFFLHKRSGGQFNDIKRKDMKPLVKHMAKYVVYAFIIILVLSLIYLVVVWGGLSLGGGS
ncbi:MAG: hypothetical protein R3251_04445 [Candidatus Spechtbacterales bacterium]|nr:hypothetical protein [Candidatus Spechtbacterales bacterium]